MLKVIKEDAPLGATILGVNLKQNLNSETISFIKDALAIHQVVFFRDQEISSLDHRNLALNFGSLQTHPAYPTINNFPEITILENDRENPSKIEEWHTDMTFKENPPLGSILIGKIIPKKGGDTLFASLAAAFDDLTDDLKENFKT